ncbi:hypothetical protein QUH73_09695, partial [Labilibaculum sp. K2S]|uniref:hypothetical protein n=1 Tax=Labilibaculum sp. K2S TaxID=3056386 RepID=UPI0025A46C26
MIYKRLPAHPLFRLESIWRKPDNQKKVWRYAGTSQTIKKKFGDLLAQARLSKKSLVICWRKPDYKKKVWRYAGTSQT